MTPSRSNLLFLSAIILVLAWTFPRHYILRSILLTPIYISATLFALISLAVYAAIKNDTKVSGGISRSRREQHALRPLRFTTPAAWSAVLTRQSWEENPSSFQPIHSSASLQLSSRLDHLLDLIKQHFILPWYERISPSPAFPTAVEGIIRHVLSNTVKRAEVVDWPTIFVSRLFPIITNHFQHYRSVEHLSSSSTIPSPNPALPLPLPTKSHPALNAQAHIPTGNTAIAPSVEEHLRKTLERILSVSLPEKQRSEVVDILVREIVLGAVLIPVFDMLCDSDFWNRQIDEKGGRYLHEQKQVDKFLSALSNLPSTSSTSPITPSKSKRSAQSATHTSSISAETSSRQFDNFLKSIGKLKTLGEARRLRADVERELRGAKLALAEEIRKRGVGKDDERTFRRASKYVERLERARTDIDARIALLSGQQGKALPTPKPSSSRGYTLDGNPSDSIGLYSVLADPSSLAYWLEYMERRNRSRLVQYWLTIEGFKDPLEAAGPDSALESTVQPLTAKTSEIGSQTILEDVVFLYEMYFAAGQKGIDIPTKHRQVIEAAAQDRAAPVSPMDIQRIKHAVFASQKAIYEQMAEEDWPAFRKSELFLKAVTDLKRADPSSIIPALVDPVTMMSPPTRSTPMRPPPLPPRQFSTPVQSSKPLLDLLSPTSRSRPLLRHGSITPASPVGPSTTISLTPPLFERSMTDNKILHHQDVIRKASAGDVDRVMSVESSGPSTPPPLPRRSSQLDFLISGGETTQENQDRARLFGDDDDMEDGDDYVEVQRMEAIQAALNEIIASDDLVNDNQPSQAVHPSQAKSPSSSMILFGNVDKSADRVKLMSRSVEDLKGGPFTGSKATMYSAPTSRQPSTAIRLSVNGTQSSMSPEKASKNLFDDEYAHIEEDETVSLDEDMDEGAHDVIQLAAPGDLQLSVEIARLQDKIQDLVQQDHLLDALIRQAELTGKQNELRILRRSQSSVRREQRTSIFQKAQFEQQEEENRLVPGRTRVSIPSSIITAEDGEHGKNVVRYTIEVSQVSDDGQTLLGWVVARRYNEFWELDRALKEWADTQQLSDELRNKVVEMPGKKLVPNMSASFVESRRSGLEKYVQSLLTSTAICDSPLLRSFLSRSPVPLKPGLDRMTSSTGSLGNLAPHNIVKSLYKTMATSLDDTLLGPSMLDMMYTTLNRQLNDFGDLVGLGGEDLAGLLPQALKGAAGAYTPQWLKYDPMSVLQNPSASSTTTSTANLSASSPIQPIALGGESGMTSFTGPICDLFIEVFDLKENNWIRRQAIVVILQQFLGGTIERKVRDTFRNATSTDSFERIFTNFEETLFPDGERRPPSESRTVEEQYATRLRASKKLALLIPDIAANMIGRGNARRAARRVFGALQDQRLNQHLVLSIIDEILNAMYPRAK